MRLYKHLGFTQMSRLGSFSKGSSALRLCLLPFLLAFASGSGAVAEMTSPLEVALEIEGVASQSSCFASTAGVGGIDAESFDSETVFQDGVYLSAADFRNNRPTLSLDSIVFSERPTSGGNRRYLYDFDFIEDFKEAREAIWGICIDGVPYINQSGLAYHESWYNEPYSSDDFRYLDVRGFRAITFIRIMYIGHLCHFTLEYTPTLGLAPIDVALDRRVGSQTSYRQKILKVSTGEIRDFKAAEMEGLISDDALIYQEYLDTRPGKRNKKIFGWFHLYNERNAITF